MNNIHQSKFGIYLNTKDLKVVRINSPYWIPSGDEWIMLAVDVNTTLVKIREIAKQKGIKGAEQIQWGDFPRI